MLSHDRRSVAFLSQDFSSTGRIKSVYERELLAVKAVTGWKHYLIEKEFVIKIDQCSLQHLLDQKSMSTVQQRWAAKLIGLNYRIEFKPGVENRVANALSRRPAIEELSHLSLSVPLTLEKEALAKEVKVNPELSSIIRELEKGGSNQLGYRIEKGDVIQE